MRRQADAKAGADDDAGPILAVLGPDHAAMGFDDLLGDRQTEPGMRAKFLAGGTLGVEAVENRGELVVRNARALILDGDQDRPPVEPRGQADLAAAAG